MKEGLLLMAYGSPGSMSEVVPYLEGIYEGRPVPKYAVAENSRKYSMVNGRSPSNQIIRKLFDAVRSALLTTGIQTYLGNKHWKPWLKDAVEDMKRDGIEHVIALPLFPFPSKNVEKSYMIPLEESVESAGNFADITFLNGFGENAMFTDMWVRLLKADSNWSRNGTLVLFTAHSLPLSQGEEHAYDESFRASAAAIASELGIRSYGYGYQSRGKYGSRWLEPSVWSVLENSHGFSRLLAVPVGFCYEHMEILYDLDTEFGSEVRKRGMEYMRTKMPDSGEDFVSLVCNQAIAASRAKEVNS
ncbi:MAG: ferrochelatase [Candidatus Thermoplasmatota archaeon]|nr:ferrochelatase [Candidatus Thermoplasmatota archaeon]MCL5793554.1 ferrochelatase [Candidatus Thermoplasmatota archaeon]